MDPKEFYLICKSTKDKLRIPEGETTIGRGPFLKVKDKRVSRAHAILSLQNGSLKVKPIHTNPTFFWHGNGKCMILKQNVWQNLNDADTISLLPNDLLFSVSINHHDDVDSNQKGIVLPKDHSMENIPIDRAIDSRETAGNRALPHLVMSNDSGACRINESLEKVHEGTFEDSIDSLENEEFDVKAHGSFDKDAKTESNIDNESCLRQLDEDELKTDQAKSAPLPSPHVVAANNSMKEKRRILPSWMLESLPAKSTARGKKNASASKRKTSEKEVEMNDDMNSLEKNKKAATAGPKSKRTKQEDKVLADMVDVCCRDSKPEDEGSKNSNEKECGHRNSEDRTITLEARNASNVETKNVGRMLVDGNEQLQGLPRNNNGQTSTQGGRRVGDEISQRLLGKEHKNEYIRKPSEEASQSSSVSHGSISVEGISTGKPIETKSKLPRCKYGKSCYRKNPVHFQEYSHSDHESDAKDTSEVAADDRPECPYGINCYRRNQQHKSEYKHTIAPSNQERQARTSRLRNRSRKSVLAEDNDDGSEDSENESVASYGDGADFESGSTSSYDDDDNDDDDYDNDDDWSPEDLD